jgi:hypothetical protein
MAWATATTAFLWPRCDMMRRSGAAKAPLEERTLAAARAASEDSPLSCGRVGPPTHDRLCCLARPDGLGWQEARGVGVCYG